MPQETSLNFSTMMLTDTTLMILQADLTRTVKVILYCLMMVKEISLTRVDINVTIKAISLMPVGISLTEKAR